MNDLLKVGIYFTAILIAIDAFANTARVKRILTKKKLVLINAGREDGLKTGSKICFYRGSKKIACGQVNRIRPKKALIKVKKIKKIKQGYLAKFKLKMKKKRYNKSSRNYRTESVSRSRYSNQETGKSNYDYAFRALYLPYIAPLTPASYNLLTYDGAHTERGGESLWRSEGLYSEGQNSSIFLSGGAEFELRNLGIRLGAHYKSYQTFRAESDYDATQPNIYMFTSLSAEAMGGYLEYAFRFSSFSFGLGVDIDATTLSLVGTRLDDYLEIPDEDIYILDGSTNIVSLRIPIRWDPYFDPVGLSIGLNVMIPLTALGTEQTLYQNDLTNGGKVLNVEDDVLTSLKFDKGTIALEFAVGAYVGF
ncbi:MAG: hypothetical protein AB8G05_06635 [Oligoflexales bacterium]